MSRICLSIIIFHRDASPFIAIGNNSAHCQPSGFQRRFSPTSLLVNHFLHNLLIGRLYTRDVSQTGGFALLYYSNWGYESSVQHMLAAGAKADIRGPLWGTRTPLLLAISRHHTTVVKILLDHGADPNVMDIVKHGPLETAILNECGDDMIDLLLEYGADVNLQAYQQRTPLFTAVISGKTTKVALLLTRGANVHARELKDGRIPLHFAAENAGSSGMVKMLLDAGSDVNCLSDSGMAPLHTAAYGHAADVVQILLDSGADVRLQTPTGDNGGQTALHYAAKSWCGSRDAIGLLVGRGADVNSRDFRQRTPLFLAARQNPKTQDTAEVLLDHGAHICARDESGCTVLHGSAQQIPGEMVKWLCGRGADVNWSNDNGETPLFAAIGPPMFSKERQKVIQTLLDLGANVNVENIQGQSPLCLAAGSGCLATVRVLLEHGAIVHHSDRERMTPLHWSTRAQMTGIRAPITCEIIGLLIEYGADVNSRNLAGQTPLDMILQQGALQVRKCLINAGGIE